MLFNKRLKRTIYTTYIEELDRTIVWQDLDLEEEVPGQSNIDIEPVQTSIMGWYHGEPTDEATESFSHNAIVAQYF